MLTTERNLSDRSTQKMSLWVSDLIAAQCLSPYFHIAFDKSDLKAGNHTIALQSELDIRRLARQLISIGAEVQVYQLEMALEAFLFPIGISAAPMILMGAIPYEQWLKSRKNEPLDLEDAVDIAEDIIKSEPDSPKRNIALDVLGRRAKVSEYNWDKKYLASIRAIFEKSLTLPDAPESLDPTERKRLELKALSQERDLDKLTDGIIAFCRRYGW